MQGRTLRLEGSNDGNLQGFQFGSECMLFQYGGIRPPSGPVELGNDWQAVLDSHLVHAVLVAVERQEPAVAVIPQVLQGGQYLLRLEI